jgi:protein-S-isoprenylcysteine O-methyltransferase Ste14
LIDTENEDGKEDIFGLPKMSTNLEIAISYVLFVLGILMVLSAVYPVRSIVPINVIYVGLLMVGVAYVFTMEAIRELEEEDHFLSRRLMKKMRTSNVEEEN